ncbi:hypothetical protein AUR61_010170 [Stutzerimonas balearica]|nr:hypothetical protein AUR61_010170 [Stutzerimonas balearica]
MLALVVIQESTNATTACQEQTSQQYSYLMSTKNVDLVANLPLQHRIVTGYRGALQQTRHRRVASDLTQHVETRSVTQDQPLPWVDRTLRVETEADLAGFGVRQHDWQLITGASHQLMSSQVLR